MKTFVNKRSELTAAKEALEAQGNNVFRTPRVIARHTLDGRAIFFTF